MKKADLRNFGMGTAFSLASLIGGCGAMDNCNPNVRGLYGRMAQVSVCVRDDTCSQYESYLRSEVYPIFSGSMSFDDFVDFSIYAFDTFGFENDESLLSLTPEDCIDWP
ncbi:hypothetical protein HYV50_01195 [Candidatus Pacearchaeota archaeon]|nr:hypothetical protein [Candidatus Pacearchaeota archaeon]